MNTVGSEFRIARSNEQKNFGWKINAKVSSGDDFVYEDEDAFSLRAGVPLFGTIRQPAIMNKMVDPLGSLTSPVVKQSEPNRYGGVLEDTYKNFSANTTVPILCYMTWRRIGVRALIWPASIRVS